MAIGTKIASATGITILGFALSYGLIACLDPVNYPIRNVAFVGNNQELSLGDMQTTIADELAPGFFRVPVSSIQHALLSLPWMNHVDIRRTWPDKLVIKFEEHRPAARWADNGFISEAGHLFFPQSTTQSHQDLPILRGPLSRSAYVWQQYLAMQTILNVKELKISQLILTPRGSWHVTLENGMMVNLGTDDTMKRLKRFVRVYKSHLQSKSEAIAYVDLRYTSGLAVGWKSS